MIHFICATFTEAKPVINYFKLRKNIKFNEFNIFNNLQTNITLTISGIGKINSACSVIYTHLNFKKEKSLWVNFGIAGHKNYKIGKLIIVNKIVDNATKDKFYPFVQTSINEQATCETYEKENFNYRKTIIDMEASGFFFAAKKIATLEFIHSIKIISDNKNCRSKVRKKDFISKIIGNKIKDIENFIIQVILFNKFFFKKKTLLNKINIFLNKINVTSLQKKEIHYFIIKWLMHNKDFPYKKVLNLENAEHIIFFLKNKLEKKNN